MRCPSCNSLKVKKKDWLHYLQFGLSCIILTLLFLVIAVFVPSMIPVIPFILLFGIGTIVLSPVLGKLSSDYFCEDCKYTFNKEVL